MTPVAAALLGVLAGVFLGVVGMAVFRRPAAPPRPPDRLADWRQVMNVLRSAVLLVSPHDEVIAANQQATDNGLIRGDRIAVPALLELVREVRRTGEAAVVNMDQVRSRRTEQKLAVRVLLLEDGLILVIADDRMAALRVQASARDFLANATHELKTPVGAIGLLAEATEQASDDPDAVVRFTRKIQSESARLTELVTQIVGLSRIQGERGRPFEQVDVDSLVALTLDHSRAHAERRGITLTTGGTNGLQVRGNPHQLQTALANLVNNAVTYSDERRRVVVTTRRVSDADAGDRVAIAVSDNGIGIAEEDQERVFERFYRVDYARSRATGGTGLGLSIVSEIVESHGGEVTLWSKVGSGSTFTILLPEAPDLDDEEDTA